VFTVLSVLFSQGTDVAATVDPAINSLTHVAVVCVAAGFRSEVGLEGHHQILQPKQMILVNNLAD
jgi:hypothetical protein